MLKHRVEHVKLASGLEGLIIDTPKTGVVVAEVGFRAGEFLLQKEKWETAHLMEHVLLGANKQYPKARDFQAAIEQHGAYSNASTSVYDITYEVESADFEWQRVLGLLFDAISTPLFLQEEFDTEMSNVREELISRSNNHFRHLNLGLRQSMDLCALTDPERIELLDGVTREDLVKHYKKTHTLPNARFIIAGNFNGKYEEVVDLVKNRLKLSKSGSRIPMPDEKPKALLEPYVVRKPSVPNIYLYLDMYSPQAMSTEDNVALRLVSTLLTETMYSRIFGTAREKGWVYSMGSGSSQMGSTTGWWMGAQVSKTNSQPLLRLMRDEALRLRDGQIDDEDFDAAQKHLLGKTMRAGQTASGLVGSYGSFYLNDEVHDLNKLPSKLKNLTANQCIKVFTELIDNSVWGIGMLGSTSKIPATKLHDYAAEIFVEPEQ
ncbi:MAG: putative Zn-dependent peptidase [Candidatus Saccharimonadales bacterium]|jgi:predicted Zn-dependent peptidase